LDLFREKLGRQSSAWADTKSNQHTTQKGYMKIKPAEKAGGVIMELGPRETQLANSARDESAPTMPAFKLKKILVPVDFTDCTEESLLYAVPFALQFGAEITLLHIVEPAYVPASEVGDCSDVETMEEAAAKLKKLGDRLAEKAPCHTLVRKGGALFEINKVARELACDLIILATHGRTGLERMVMGSTSEKVVRYAGCPVLVVRKNEHEFVTES
jgi:universal stress protein A